MDKRCYFFRGDHYDFVGIDVAKDTHYAAVSDDSGAVLVKPFAFQNNAEGFCLLLKSCRNLTAANCSSVWNQPEFIPKTSSAFFTNPVSGSLSSILFRQQLCAKLQFAKPKQTRSIPC